MNFTQSVVIKRVTKCISGDSDMTFVHLTTLSITLNVKRRWLCLSNEICVYQANHFILSLAGKSASSENFRTFLQFI